MLFKYRSGAFLLAKEYFGPNINVKKCVLLSQIDMTFTLNYKKYCFQLAYRMSPENPFQFDPISRMKCFVSVLSVVKMI